MKFINPLEMNDWGIKIFFLIIILLQVSFWEVILLNILGIHIPLFEEIISIINIIFVPGILFLRTLKLHKLGSVKTFLFTIGSSVSLIMAVGFLLNIIFLQFGKTPLTFQNIIGSMIILSIILSITAYIQDKNYSNPSFLEMHDLKSLILYFSILLLLLTIIGTCYMNYYSSNILSLICILLIPIIVLAVIFDKVSFKLYPLLIFIISISLLFHNSLISNYIWGWDIMKEYNLANMISSQSFWDYNMPVTYNGMLSTTILGPFFKKIINLDMIWVYKIIFPLIFSFVPLGIYEITQKQTNPKIGFLSSFFFMSFYVFFIEMFQLPRQQIAELFIVLIIILFLEDQIDFRLSILMIIFSLSIVVSHYATSYIIIFTFILAWFIVKVLKYIERNVNTKTNPIFKRLRSIKFSDNSETQVSLKINYILLLVCMAAFWYIYITSSANFDIFINISNHIVTNLMDDFLAPSSTQSIYLITRSGTIIQNIEKYLNLISQFFIFVGLVCIFLNLKKCKFKVEYMAIAFAAFLVAVAGIIVPNFASTINTSRLYHITLLFLAPFCIIGGMMLVNKILRLKDSSKALKIFTIFLIIFFLFNTKIVYEITDQNAPTPGLNPNYDYSLFNEMEVIGVSRLAEFQEIKRYSDIPSQNGSKMYRETYIYADGYRMLLLISFGINVSKIPTNFNSIPTDSYLFLGTKNIKENKILIAKPPFSFNYTSSNGLINKMDKIYDNGGSQIFY